MASKNMPPKDWQLTTLGAVSDVRRGASPRPIGNPKWFSDKGPGWVRIVDVTRSRKYLRQTEQQLSEAGASKSVRVSPGDVIMSICATIGCPVIVDMDACIHDGFVLFDKLSKAVDPEYLCFFLAEETERFARQGQKGTQGNLNTSIVKGTQLLLPPKKVQARIVNTLNAFDEAIEATHAVIAQTQNLKASLLQDLLTNGLPGRHKTFSEVKRIGRIPADWSVTPLADLIKTDRPICYGILMPGRGFEGGVPVIKVKDLINGRIDEVGLLLTDPALDEEYRRSRLQTGDLLLSIRGTTGRVAKVPKTLNNANITQDTARLSIQDPITTDFVYYCLQGRALQNQIQHHTIGQAVKGINIEEVRRLPIPLPSPSEMSSIVELFHRVEERLESESLYLDQLILQKSALSQGLLTGRIPVKGVD